MRMETLQETSDFNNCSSSRIKKDSKGHIKRFWYSINRFNIISLFPQLTEWVERKFWIGNQEAKDFATLKYM